MLSRLMYPKGIMVLISLLLPMCLFSETGDEVPGEQLRHKAEEVSAKAQYKIGLICGMGKGVAQDYKESLKWYINASEARKFAAE